MHPACCSARCRRDSGLETSPVDWAPEPTFQKQAVSCHLRPPSVAGPQHIVRWTSSPPRPVLGEAAVKMQNGHVRWGFALFRSLAPPALTVSCQRIRGLKSSTPLVNYHRHLGHLKVAADINSCPGGMNSARSFVQIFSFAEQESCSTGICHRTPRCFPDDTHTEIAIFS